MHGLVQSHETVPLKVSPGSGAAWIRFRIGLAPWIRNLIETSADQQPGIRLFNDFFQL
jgi:hypothetical protein